MDKIRLIIVGIQICCIKPMLFIKALIGISDIQELADRRNGPRFYAQFGMKSNLPVFNSEYDGGDNDEYCDPTLWKVESEKTE